MQKIVALGLRGGGILGKFLLTFLLTKEISLEFQGEFSLMNANIILLVVFIGFDFYVYSNRLIVKDAKQLIFVFKNSLVFYFISYLILIPICFLLWQMGLVSKEILVVFFILSILEHLGQELFRIYIALEKVVFANVLFFFRAGLWSWLIVGYLLFFSSDLLTLYGLLVIWAISSLIAVGVGVAGLPNITSFPRISIDKKWIIKGIKVGASVFLATLLLKVVEYSDRYFIDFFLDKKALGIYTFYFQLANIINVLVFTLYISFIYPKILKSVYSKDRDGLKKNKTEIYKSTLVIVTSLVVVFLLALPAILDIMNKTELDANKGVLFVLILSTLFFNFSYGSHYVLIAEEKERLIVKTTFFAFLVNVTLNLILIPTIGIYGASIALALSSLVLWISKLREEKKLLNKW